MRPAPSDFGQIILAPSSIVGARDQLSIPDIGWDIAFAKSDSVETPQGSSFSAKVVSGPNQNLILSQGLALEDTRFDLGKLDPILDHQDQTVFGSALENPFALAHIKVEADQSSIPVSQTHSEVSNLECKQDYTCDDLTWSGVQLIEISTPNAPPLPVAVALQPTSPPVSSDGEKQTSLAESLALSSGSHAIVSQTLSPTLVANFESGSAFAAGFQSTSDTNASIAPLPSMRSLQQSTTLQRFTDTKENITEVVKVGGEGHIARAIANVNLAATELSSIQETDKTAVVFPNKAARALDEKQNITTPEPTVGDKRHIDQKRNFTQNSIIWEDSARDTETPVTLHGFVRQTSEHVFSADRPNPSDGLTIPVEMVLNDTPNAPQDEASIEPKASRVDHAVQILATDSTTVPRPTMSEISSLQIDPAPLLAESGQLPRQVLFEENLRSFRWDPTAFPRNEPPTPVQQAAIAVISSASADFSGQIELTLTPDELGSVRFDMRPDGEGMSIVLSAERPETLDLMRRNTADLIAELKQSGIQMASFTFGTWSEKNQKQEQFRSSEQDEGVQTISPSPPVKAPRLGTLITSALDLRF